MTINRKLKKECDAQKTDVLNEMKRYCQWTSEKNSIGANKLLEAFKPTEHSDMIVLKSLKGNKRVRSYRIPRLLPSTIGVLEATESQLAAVREARREADGGPAYVPKPSRSDELFEQMYDGFRRGTLFGAIARRLKYGLEYVKRARERRAARRWEWEKLYKLKPSDDYEDPGDVAAIEEAARTLGMKILRDDESSAQKIRVQQAVHDGQVNLAQIECEMHDRMQAFNNKLLQLRERKCTIIGAIRTLRQRLIDESDRFRKEWAWAEGVDEFDEVDLPEVPLLHEEEVPENMYVSDEKDLTRFRKSHDDGKPEGKLSTYLPPKLVKEKRMSVRNVKADETSKPSRQYYRGEARTPPPVVTAFLDQIGMAQQRPETLSRRDRQEPESDPPSAAQQEFMTIQRITLDYHVSVVKNIVEELTSAFDFDFNRLLSEKLELDVLLKRADLRYITVMEELMISKKSMSKEAGLTAKVSKAEADLQRHTMVKEDLLTQIADINRELLIMSEEATSLFYSFQDTVRDVSPKRQRFFTKIFKTRLRVKRARTDSESSESSSDSSFSSDESDDSETQKVHEEIDVCPEDVSYEVFDAVWELQKKRQHMDDTTASLKFNLDRCQKDLERMAPLAENLARAAKEALKNLFSYRYMIQKELNMLDVVVPLRLWQLNVQGRSATHEYISHGVVMEDCDLKTLRGRPHALTLELKECKEHFKQQSLELVALRRDNNALHKKLLSWERKCDEEMMKKFGRVIPLDTLELAMVNPKKEALRQRLASEKTVQMRELARCDEKIKVLRQRLAAVTRDNTELCRIKADMMTYCMDVHERLGGMLKKNETNVLMRPRKTDVKRLQLLVDQQQKEIALCQREIDSLYTKAGETGLRPVCVARPYLYHSLPTRPVLDRDMTQSRASLAL
nr:hypothetical protein BaRGS_028472 [Batillaria attramentaria]